MNMIVSIAVPVGSRADAVLREWQDAGLNRSEQVRQAIERSAATEADRRKIMALGWALAMRGICPTVIAPEVTNSGTEKFPIVTKPRFHIMHSCSECEKWTGTPRQIERAGISPHFAQSVIQPLKELWRDFDWSDPND